MPPNREVLSKNSLEAPYDTDKIKTSTATAEDQLPSKKRGFEGIYISQLTTQKKKQPLPKN